MSEVNQVNLDCYGEGETKFVPLGADNVLQYGSQKGDLFKFKITDN